MKKRRRIKMRQAPPAVAPQPVAAPYVALPGSLQTAKMSDPTLEAVEQRVESQIAPRFHEPYLKIVMAGLRMAMAPSRVAPQGLLAELHKSQDVVGDCVKGSVSLLLVMHHQAKGVMPTQAMVPAGMTLLLKALDYAHAQGLLSVDNDLVAHATQEWSELLFKGMGITKPMVDNLTSKVRSVTNDPTQMELVNRRVGVTQDPRASQPTVPGGTP